jgi:hypothetical protein
VVVFGVRVCGGGGTSSSAMVALFLLASWVASDICCVQCPWERDTYEQFSGILGHDPPSRSHHSFYLHSPVYPFAYGVRVLCFPVHVLVEYYPKILSACYGFHFSLQQSQWHPIGLIASVGEVYQCQLGVFQ